MKLLRRTALFLTPLVLASCSSAPITGPNGFLTGTWGDRPPSGAQTIMTLTASRGYVSGTASAYQIQRVNPVSGTVSGTYSGGGFFTLNFEFASGTKATWTGNLQESGWLVGTWTQTAPTPATGTEAMVRSTP